MCRKRATNYYLRYKNIFDKNYDISICKESEIEDVITFIDTYWKKGHALVASKALLDWQHYNCIENTYNFIIARSQKDGEIHALEGFIPTSQFDPNIITPMTWGAIWKTRTDVAPPGLGIMVKQYRELKYATPYAAEIGISPDAYQYNKQSGHSIFELEPWCMVNPFLNEFHLLECDDLPETIAESENTGGVDYWEIGVKEWDEVASKLEFGSIPPFKSSKYFIQRYYKHPIYKYEAICLWEKQSQKIEILIYRKVTLHDSNCIFIVDYLGKEDVLKKSKWCLYDLMKQNNSEYILFLCHGLRPQVLESAGFFDRRKSNIIIPVYYEPFLKENVDIICTTNQTSKWFAFKGDADQDRPNCLSV